MIILKTQGKHLIFISDSTNPTYNLACEEYLLTKKSEEFLFLWRSSASVIIGRNQNAHAEINLDFVQKNNIPVVRRLTGGGAVFHDLGNINFSYIINSDKLVDLKNQFSKIIDFLKSIGLDAVFSGRNDIIADGYKISGTAQVSKNGRAIVHGTLLYSADLSVLSEALTPNPLKLQSKGISSVKSRVANISALLDIDKTPSQFLNDMYYFLLNDGDCPKASFSETDVSEIEKLRKSKYSTWDWNFGDAPKFTIEKSVLSSCGLLTANYTVRNGLIENIRFFGDFNALKEICELEKLFVGLSTNPDFLKEQIGTIDFNSFIQNSTTEDFLKLFN